MNIFAGEKLGVFRTEDRSSDMGHIVLPNWHLEGSAREHRQEDEGEGEGGERETPPPPNVYRGVNTGKS